MPVGGRRKKKKARSYEPTSVLVLQRVFLLALGHVVYQVMVVVVVGGVGILWTAC